MSYNGQLNFGLTGDFDAMPDLETLAEELQSSIEELAAVASAPTADQPAVRGPTPVSSPIAGADR
jgi:hypothetical protein